MIVDSFIATGALFADELMKPEKRFAVYFTEQEIRALNSERARRFDESLRGSDPAGRIPHPGTRSAERRITEKVAYLNHLRRPKRERL